jgi:hypothetical protein
MNLIADLEKGASNLFNLTLKQIYLCHSGDFALVQFPHDSAFLFFLGPGFVSFMT